MPQPRLIKLNIKGLDCKNIYYVDSHHQYDTFKELGDRDVPNKQQKDFKLILKVSPLVNGKQKIVKKTYKFSRHETLKSAIKFVADKRLELFETVKCGEYHKPTKAVIVPTLKEAGEIYWESPHLSDEMRRSLKSFRNVWLSHLLDIPVTEISTTDLQKVVNDMLNQGKKPRTALGVKDCLNPVYKRLIAEGVVSVNPVTLIKLPKYDNTVYIEISDAEIKAVMHEIYTYDVEPYRTVLIWLTHGRRLNEVLSIEYDDLNFEDNSYSIKPDINKARRTMTYGLTDDLIEGIKRQDATEISKRTGLVFKAIRTGEKIYGATVREHWLKVLALASTENNPLKLRLHDIRHIIGSTLVSSGKTLEEVAAVLGHTNTSITKRYSKVRRTVSDSALKDFFDIVKKDEGNEDDSDS